MITVRYFASLREQLGRDSDHLPAQTLSVRECWQQAAAHLAMPSNLLCAINGDYAELDSVANDGDEVAFFPPVTGG